MTIDIATIQERMEQLDEFSDISAPDLFDAIVSEFDLQEYVSDFGGNEPYGFLGYLEVATAPDWSL